MPREINDVQQLQLELISRVRFNQCAGKRVVADLLEHRDLWDGVIMLQSFPGRDGYPSLIPLRDIGHGRWNVDTLYLLSSKVDDTKLEAIAKTWDADEVAWIDDTDVGLLLGISPTDDRVLVVWWD